MGSEHDVAVELFNLRARLYRRVEALLRTKLEAQDSEADVLASIAADLLQSEPRKLESPHYKVGTVTRRKLRIVPTQTFSVLDTAVEEIPQFCDRLHAHVQQLVAEQSERRRGYLTPQIATTGITARPLYIRLCDSLAVLSLDLHNELALDALKLPCAALLSALEVVQLPALIDSVRNQLIAINIEDAAIRSVTLLQELDKRQILALLGMRYTKATPAWAPPPPLAALYAVSLAR